MLPLFWCQANLGTPQTPEPQPLPRHHISSLWNPTLAGMWLGSPPLLHHNISPGCCLPAACAVKGGNGWHYPMLIDVNSFWAQGSMRILLNNMCIPHNMCVVLSRRVGPSGSNSFIIPSSCHTHRIKYFF